MTRAQEQEQKTTPGPGIYYDVDFEDYLKWDAVSNSRLKLVEQSLEHYKHGLTLNPESDHLLFGSLVHAGKLEPDSVLKRYAVMPNYAKDPNNVDKKGKRSYHKTTWVEQKQAEWHENFPDVQAVSEDFYIRMKGILDALMKNTRAQDVLTGGKAEVSILWEDVETGLMCKARIDMLKRFEGIFTDLKTSQDAGNFEKHLIKFGYHRQTAFYQRGWLTLTDEMLQPWIVAVDKTEPYGNRAAPVCKAALKEGLEAVQADLHAVAEAEVTGYWPGYENPSYWDGDEYHRNRRPLTLTIAGESIEL